MLNKITLVFSVLFLTHSAVADIAIYRDGTFTLPTGAVVNPDNTVDYYSDIVFTANANGTLTPVSAELRSTTGSSVAGEAGYYENGQIFIPRGAVVFADGDAQYYGDIILSVNEDGTVSPVAAEARPAVEITDVSVQNFSGFPNYVTVNVSGNKSRACVELEDVGFNRQEEQDGKVFTIIVAEAELEDGVSCDPDPTPFTVAVDLPVCTCAPGDYTAVVNGTHQAFFTLEE